MSRPGPTGKSQAGKPSSLPLPCSISKTWDDPSPVPVKHRCGKTAAQLDSFSPNMGTTIPAEGAWLSSTRMASVDAGSLAEVVMDDRPPVHPVPTMQGAFEESMMETMNEIDESPSLDRYSKADSVSRRKMLLEQEEYERTVAGRWKQKPGEKFHPLWKLVAQISFGMHLLQQALAKSDEEVIKILQTHVDEVDGFLERTTEDFDLAQGDINERIRYLRLPLEHGQVFDTMLNDRSFRMAIVEGNEKIEHIVDRTATAMNDALKDVQKGLDATRELAKYLTRLDRQWGERSDEHESVYLAMIGNTEGWSRAFQHLRHKGKTLGVALVQLGGLIAEMQRRAGIASRKNLVAAKPVHGKYYVEYQSPVMSSRHSISPPLSPNKPLPAAPDSIAQAVQSVTPHKHPKTGHAREPSRNMGQAHPKQPKKSSKNEIQAEPAPAVPQETPGKTPSRRTSFSERTLSLTRKLFFFKDRDENNGSSVNLSSHDPSSRRSHAQRSISPAPEAVSTRSEVANNPFSDLYRRTPPADRQHPAPPSGEPSNNSPASAAGETTYPLPLQFSMEALQHSSPTSVPSANPTNHFNDVSQDARDRTTILFVGNHHNKQALSESWTYPSKVVGTATAPTARALPLRNLRSSERLQATTFCPPSYQATVTFLPKRTTSSQDSPTKLSPSPTNLSATPSLLNVSTPNPSTTSPAVTASAVIRQVSLTAPSNDGETPKLMPITQTPHQIYPHLDPSPNVPAAQAPPAVTMPTHNSQNTTPQPMGPATHDGATSSAPLIDFLLAHPAPTRTSPPQPVSAHSRGPSSYSAQHSTTSATSTLHHRQHSGSGLRRSHMIHPSISHEDIKALGKRERTSDGKMTGTRPSGWKKVFGNGVGGHKKSKSESSNKVERVLRLKTVGVDRPRMAGTGKDGVWISRKNFLKT